MGRAKKAPPKLTGGIRSDDEHIWRTENIGRLLLHSFRVHENRLLTRAHQVGFPELRRGYLNVFRHIDYGGTKLNELARRANITKAAMGQLVAACERLNLVRVDVHPHDRRAKLVRFTARGRRLMKEIGAIIANLEAEFERVLGKARYETLRGILNTLRRDL